MPGRWRPFCHTIPSAIFRPIGQPKRVAARLALAERCGWFRAQLTNRIGRGSAMGSVGMTRGRIEASPRAVSRFGPGSDAAPKSPNWGHNFVRCGWSKENNRSRTYCLVFECPGRSRAFSASVDPYRTERMSSCQARATRPSQAELRRRRFRFGRRSGGAGSFDRIRLIGLGLSGQFDGSGLQHCGDLCRR